jgi:glucokinase
VTDLVVGVDIGGTKTAVLVAAARGDTGGAVRTRTTSPTAVGAPERAADVIARLVDDALRAAGARRTDVAAIGIGVPGRVDRERGHVTLAVNLGWHDLALGPRVAEILGIPTVVENDVRAGALGLHRRRVFGDVESLALLAVGTGIAAGVVLHGELYRGALGLAGEIGHVVIDPNGPRCACGNTGCFETVAAGPAIVAQARAGWAARADGRSRDGRPAAADPGAGGNAASAEAVFAAAAMGDGVAIDVIERAGRAIAWGIHLLALAYDVERIVLSGGVSHAGEALAEPIRRELDRYRQASPLAAEVLPPDRVHFLPAGADAGAWGAVTIARAMLAAGGTVKA